MGPPPYVYACRLYLSYPRTCSTHYLQHHKSRNLQHHKGFDPFFGWLQMGLYVACLLLLVTEGVMSQFCHTPTGKPYGLAESSLEAWRVMGRRITGALAEACGTACCFVRCFVWMIRGDDPERCHVGRAVLCRAVMCRCLSASHTPTECWINDW